MTAFKNKSAVAAGHQCALTADGGALTMARFGQPIAVADHVVGAKGVIGVLPAGTVPSFGIVSAPALGAGFKASIGVLDVATGGISTAEVNGGGAWVVDNTTGAAGGSAQVIGAALAAVQPTDEDRLLVLQVTGAGTAAGLLTFSLAYHNA